MTSPERPTPNGKASDLDSPALLAGDLSAFADDAAAELASGCGSSLVDSWFERAKLPPPKTLRNPARDQIDHPRLQSLYDYWCGLPRGGDCPEPLPDAGALDALELQEWLGDLMLLEVLDKGQDFRYRVYGSSVAAHVGFDLTGKRTSEVGSFLGIGSLIPLYFLAVYRRTVLDRCAWYGVHQPPQTVTAFFWRRLILPFADQNGEVTRLLVGILPSSRDGHTRQSVTFGRRVP